MIAFLISIYYSLQYYLSEGLSPTVELNEDYYYITQELVVDFIKNNVTITDKLIKRFEEFLSSSFNKTSFCGVSMIDFKNIKYLIFLFFCKDFKRTDYF